MMMMKVVVMVTIQRGRTKGNTPYLFMYIFRRSKTLCGSPFIHLWAHYCGVCYCFQYFFIFHNRTALAEWWRWGRRASHPRSTTNFNPILHYYYYYYQHALPQELLMDEIIKASFYACSAADAAAAAVVSPPSFLKTTRVEGDRGAGGALP